MLQFETKVKYEKEINGSFKKVTESYLLPNCESFTEAETIANTIILGDVKGVKSVETINKRKYQYVLHNKGGGDWYKCKTTLEIENEESDKVTTVRNEYLVQAESIDDASSFLQDFFSDDMQSMDISGITRTAIISVMEDRVSEINDELVVEEEGG